MRCSALAGPPVPTSPREVSRSARGLLGFPVTARLSHFVALCFVLGRAHLNDDEALSRRVSVTNRTEIPLKGVSDVVFDIWFADVKRNDWNRALAVPEVSNFCVSCDPMLDSVDGIDLAGTGPALLRSTAKMV